MDLAVPLSDYLPLFLHSVNKIILFANSPGKQRCLSHIPVELVLPKSFKAVCHSWFGACVYVIFREILETRQTMTRFFFLLQTSQIRARMGSDSKFPCSASTLWFRGAFGYAEKEEEKRKTLNVCVKLS